MRLISSFLLCTLVLAGGPPGAAVENTETQAAENGCEDDPCHFTLPNCETYISKTQCEEAGKDHCMYTNAGTPNAKCVGSITAQTNSVATNKLPCTWQHGDTQNNGPETIEIHEFVYIKGSTDKDGKDIGGVDCVKDCQAACGLHTCFIPLWSHSELLEAVGLNGLHNKWDTCNKWRTRTPDMPPGAYNTGTCDSTGASHPGNGATGLGNECLNKVAKEKAEELKSTLADLVNILRRKKEDLGDIYFSYEDKVPTTDEMDIASAETFMEEEMELSSPYSLPCIFIYIFGFIVGRKATISFEDSKMGFELSLEHLAVEEL